jgi:hypothetical protein
MLDRNRREFITALGCANSRRRSSNSFADSAIASSGSKGLGKTAPVRGSRHKLRHALRPGSAYSRRIEPALAPDQPGKEAVGSEGDDLRRAPPLAPAIPQLKRERSLLTNFGQAGASYQVLPKMVERGWGRHIH